MSYFVRNKLVLLKNTFFLKIKSKFNKGLHESRVIHTNPYKTFWILIPVYFTFRKFKINGTVALCQKKKTVCDSNQKPHYKSKHMYILE